MKLLRMTSKLPAERFPIAHPTAGVESGDRSPQCRGLRAASVAVLDQFVEFSRFCFICDSEQIFRAGWECDSGLLGCCLGCGDERIAPWTRTCVEVA